jgi:hypothetical protein
MPAPYDLTGDAQITKGPDILIVVVCTTMFAVVCWNGRDDRDVRGCGLEEV